jgi:predicted transcriptional regulator
VRRKRKQPAALGERELDIMQALWRLGSATVGATHAELVARGNEVAYTTVQTMLNRLEAKGVVARDTSDRAHRYRPVVKEPAVVGGAIQRLVGRFFHGSREALAIRLVENDFSLDQLERIQAIIDENRERGRKQ